MSYCRWTSSDIFLYQNNNGSIVCCGCQLNSQDGDRLFNSRERAIAHVEAHIAYGDSVPDNVIERLLQEIAEDGDDTNRGRHVYTRGLEATV